jgi:hypothetical protein
MIGGLVFIYVSLTRGECIENCGYWDAEYRSDPIMVIAGMISLLVSTLAYQVINVFALHVHKSHFE